MEMCVAKVFRYIGMRILKYLANVEYQKYTNAESLTHSQSIDPATYPFIHSSIHQSINKSIYQLINKSINGD